MKKTLLTAILALAGFAAQAQLADGTVAPDFTATDINGVSHTLSSYLAAGKTVIMDISATWCGPCWNYHKGGALEDIYDAYGVNASDEIVVLFVEGDPATSVSSIYGVNTSSDTSVTQGDWTIGSPYAIIDDGDGSISNDYNIAYFPTVYMICPGGTTTLIDQKTAAQIKTAVNAGCGTLTGVQNYPKTTATDVRVCDAVGDFVYKAKLKNFGANKITSATVVVEQAGNVVATKAYTSSAGLSQFSSTTITFPSATFDASLDYDVRVTDVNNGSTIYSLPLAMQAFDVAAAALSNNHIEVRVYTDNYPSEISWNIKSSAGTIVASGGPYQAGTDDTYGGGGPDANTMISSVYDIPEGNSECYTVTMIDGYGDGWSLSNTDFQGIEIVSTQGIVFSQSGDQAFTTAAPLVVTSAFKTTGVLGTASVTADKFAVYPNPTKGILNFTTQETVSVTITDLTGKTVYTAAGIENGGSINLTGLQAGMYIAQIKGAASLKTEKIVVE